MQSKYCVSQLRIFTCKLLILRLPKVLEGLSGAGSPVTAILKAAAMCRVAGGEVLAAGGGGEEAWSESAPVESGPPPR